MGKLIKQKKPNLHMSLREFYMKRNKILILREVGGLGDILMHRMMFEDFKTIMPDAEIIWAVPPEYLDAAANHPFVKEVINCRETKVYDYVISYNTTTACGRHEQKVAPFSDKHRSDIWANHCGVILTKHNMHLKSKESDLQQAKKTIENSKFVKNAPTVIFCPISAMEGKNLDSDQIKGVCKGLLAKGCNVLGLHKSPIQAMNEINIPCVWGTGILQWMAILEAADYVISVDTAAFHLSGGLCKPLVGIFTYIDGKTYGKYFDFILVQKHRDLDSNWTCGPCFDWSRCMKCPQYVTRKPCASEITVEMIMEGAEKMFKKWPKY